MNLRITKLVGIIFSVIILCLACTSTSNKKEISIAYPNWADGIAITHLVKVILEDQGYQVDLMNADIAPIFSAVSRGKSDLYLDMWMPVTHADYMEKYGDDLEVIGNLYNNARIALVVPEYVTINSIEELNAHKEEFGGEIVGIDAGAGIMKATEKAINQYQLDYKLLTSSGPAMTASLKKAIDEQRWIVVTGWTPHWMFSRFNLKLLQDPKKLYGAAERVQAIAWKGFSEKHPFVNQLITNIKFTDDTISSLMRDLEGASDLTAAARGWVSKHKELVQGWIPKQK